MVGADRLSSIKFGMGGADLGTLRQLDQFTRRSSTTAHSPTCSATSPCAAWPSESAFGAQPPGTRGIDQFIGEADMIAPRTRFGVAIRRDLLIAELSAATSARW